MSTRPKITARKKPRQQRSSELVDAIAEAAIRVLATHGPTRFTTVRVAEAAGVSVGSLYQYFPSKEALLFRIQTDEWDETWSVIEDILGNAAMPPLDRLRRMMLAFFESERQEAAVRGALDDAGARFRESPEARVHMTNVTRRMQAFFDELLPDAPRDARAFAADFLMTSMGAVAERITADGRSRAEVDAWAQASADMYVAWLTTFAARHR